MRHGRMHSGLLGLLIAGTALAAQPVETRPARQSDPQCPQCGLTLEGDFTWCPQCGSRIKPYSCDYCQGRIPVDAQSCPHCGAPAR